MTSSWTCMNFTKLCEVVSYVNEISWWRHQMETFSALLALCAGNSPVPVNSAHKGQWRGALMFSLICARINDWVNSREAGDLRRHRGHYDVNVMQWANNGARVAADPTSIAAPLSVAAELKVCVSYFDLSYHPSHCNRIKYQSPHKTYGHSLRDLAPVKSLLGPGIWMSCCSVSSRFYF